LAEAEGVADAECLCLPPPPPPPVRSDDDIGKDEGWEEMCDAGS